MSSSERTQAAVRRSRWPGWIWGIPIAAVAILAWLGARFFFSHGSQATVYFERAPGVSAPSTEVTYRGVQVGEVSDVALTPDGQQVRVRLSLDRSVRKYLRSGTRFWLQGLSTDLTDMPSLMSAISGPTIQMEPGPGSPQRVFTALAQPPAFPIPTAGTRLNLLARTRGSAKVGAGVYYLGLTVGKVTAVQFVPPDRFRVEVLIRAPYDRLVHADSRFWDAGALELSVSNGLKVQLLSVTALLQGAIAFQTPARATAEPAIADGSVFTLYADQSSAQLAPVGPYLLYAVQLPGAVGGLQVGAAVKLRDFVVGEVRDVGFGYDARTGALSTPVIMELDADRLHLATRDGVSEPGRDAQVRRLLSDAVAQLVREGLRARLAQDPALVGPYYVALDMMPHPRAAAVDETSSPPVIPAASGGGLETLTTQLGQLPIQQIGDNVRVITGRIRMLIDSPQTQQALVHLDQTLANVDQMVRQAKPQVQPLIADLRRAAGQLQELAVSVHRSLGGPDEQGGLDETLAELTRTARSVRSLADYLERHPASLLKGKQP